MNSMRARIRVPLLVVLLLAQRLVLLVTLEENWCFRTQFASRSSRLPFPDSFGEVGSDHSYLRESNTQRHSSRNATIGSTLVVRHAGMSVAANATAANSAGTATKVVASVVLTPNNMLAVT